MGSTDLILNGSYYGLKIHDIKCIAFKNKGHIWLKLKRMIVVMFLKDKIVVTFAQKLIIGLDKRSWAELF